LPFYLKQRIILIDWLGELRFGAAQEENPLWFFKTDELKDFWGNSNRVFFVVNKKNKNRFVSLLSSFDINAPELLGENNRNAVYMKY
jgi:hypothetical protein